MKHFKVVVFPHSGLQKIVRIANCKNESEAENYGEIIRDRIDPYAMYDVSEVSWFIALLHMFFNRTNGLLAQR